MISRILLKKIKKTGLITALTVSMIAPCVPVLAAGEITFNVKYTIVDGADNHFIAKDQSGHYGLLDVDKDTTVEFEYDDMLFPNDTEQYHYVKIKQGDNWGIVDYKENVLVPPRYDKVCVFKNDNTIAAGYDGNKTFLYDLKGKEQKNTLSGDYTNVISDIVFASSTDVRNERNNQLFDLKEEGLLYTDPDDSSKTSTKLLKAGEHIAAQYYCDNKSETFGKLKTDRYIKIYDRKGKLVRNVTPLDGWVEDEENNIDGSLILNKAVSDDSIQVTMKMPEGKDTFRMIYSLENDKFSRKYKTIGEFTGHRAFAITLDDDLVIIDEKGEEISEDPISKEGYKREAELQNKESAKIKAAFVKFVKDGGIKLYSLTKNKELEETYKEVIFRENGYVILKNDNDEYGVMDKNCKTIVEFGKYGKDDLDSSERAFYRDTCVTVVKESGEQNEVHAWSFVKEKKNGIFSIFKEHKLLAFALAGAAVLLLILIVVLILMRKKKKREEEAQKQRELLEQQRRKKEEQERRNRLRERQRNRQFTDNRPKVEKRQNQTMASGFLKGLKGEYAGTMIRIKSGDKVRIGRSPENNDLIINNVKVSRKHCQIAYDGMTGKYRVTDYSYNGVYLSNGKKLDKNVEVLLDEGTILCIGNEENVFELGSRRS